MHSDVLNYIANRHLDREYIERKCKTTNDTIIIPIYSLTGQTGTQERYITPKNGIKSRTTPGSKGFYFLNGWDREKEILIVEGEIDFLSIIPYATDYNVMGLKGVNNLTTAIKEIETLQKTYDIYILVDNDTPADETIKRIPYTELHLYDVRDAINGHKDVNDAICAGELNLKAIPRRIVKLKPEPKKTWERSETYDTLERINDIPAIDVLEGLFPEYRRKGETILEDGKETHGYKYSKSLNIVTDFSGKGRPHGTPFQIAKHKFGDSHLTFLYFKGKI